MKILDAMWEDLLIGAIAAVLVFFALVVVSSLLGRAARMIVRRTSTKFDDNLLKSLGKIHPLILVLFSVYVSSLFLEFPPPMRGPLSKLVLVSIIIQCGLWVSTLIKGGLPSVLERSNAQTASALVNFLASILLWSIVALLVLENIGIDISALVAGLGIGGVAVAIAVQNVLGDILASLSIFLDKPFEVGDFIVVGDLSGHVERIGIKSTRIRSLGGEQLVFSNLDLLSSRVKNFKRMYERRIIFGFGVTYQTSRAMMEKIPQLVREIIEKQPMVRFDRAHFKDFGDSALNFEAVYFVLDPSVTVWFDTQQRINLEIMRVCEEHNVSFAYPTRTVFLTQEQAA